MRKIKFKVLVEKLENTRAPDQICFWYPEDPRWCGITFIGIIPVL